MGAPAAAHSAAKAPRTDTTPHTRRRLDGNMGGPPRGERTTPRVCRGRTTERGRGRLIHASVDFFRGGEPRGGAGGTSRGRRLGRMGRTGQAVLASRVGR